MTDIHGNSQHSDKSLRISSVRGHNDNLHFRESSISRPAEYLIARSNGKSPPTINPFQFKSNNKDGRKTHKNLFALAYSYENHNNSNDNKFGLEKMFVGDNTKSRAAPITAIPNPTAIKVPIMASTFPFL